MWPTAVMTDRTDYPLGFVSGASEIWESYREEAALLGVFAMIWNRHELSLKRLFLFLVTPHREFAEAIWDQANTHKGKMTLFGHAVAHVPMSEENRSALREIISETTRLSVRRNALIHAEYVIHTETMDIAARTYRRDKPSTYIPASVEELTLMINDLDRLSAKVDRTSLALLDPTMMTDLMSSIRATEKSLKLPK